MIRRGDFSEENAAGVFCEAQIQRHSSRKIAVIFRRFAAARTSIRTPNIFSTRSTKRAGKIFCGDAPTIAAIFRGDFALHFRAKKKSPRIC